MTSLGLVERITSCITGLRGFGTPGFRRQVVVQRWFFAQFVSPGLKPKMRTMQDVPDWPAESGTEADRYAEGDSLTCFSKTALSLKIVDMITAPLQALWSGVGSAAACCAFNIAQN